MSTADGHLICAYDLDGQGGAEALTWEAVVSQSGPSRRTRWVHLNRREEATRSWLVGDSTIDPLVVDALLMEDTRPRATAFADGLLLNLRGVNLNPETNPADMISVRMWIDGGRIISTRFPRIMAIQDVRDRLAAGSGPTNQGDFIIMLARLLMDRMEPVIDSIDDQLSEVETQMLDAPEASLRSQLSRLRRTTITLRRHVASQREALSQIPALDFAWLSERNRIEARELLDRITRYVEELEGLRDRAGLAQEELANQLAERMNRNMYVLTIVAGIFLPLGLLTGLLGINVGGIPGTENPLAFAFVCALLVALLVVEVMFFRRLKWL